MLVFVVKSNMKNVGMNILKTGANIVKDVVSGKKFKDAAKSNFSRGLKRTAEDLDWQAAPPLVPVVGPHLVKTGANLLGDAMDGKRRKQSQGIKPATQKTGRQTGSGRGRRRTRRGKLQRDIFS